MALRRNNALKSKFFTNVITVDNISEKMEEVAPPVGAPTIITSDNIETILNNTGVISNAGTGSGVTSTVIPVVEGQDTVVVDFNPSNLYVYIDGILSSPDSYVLNGFESITFNTAFEKDETLRIVTMSSVRGNITEKDFIAQDGQTEFVINYIPSQVNVFIHGIKLQNDEYDASSGTKIVLNYECSEDDWVQIVKW